jgi:PRTRC genetic system protein C
MALVATALARSFRTGSTSFPDPGNSYTPEEVKQFYELTHGFLVNFVIEGPTYSNGQEIYEFVKSVGTKG